MSEENKKIKIVLLGDHPMAPSGVGTQLKYIIETLLKTGRFQFICLGGAVSHLDYQPKQVPASNGEWELGDWIIHPVDGYGNQDMIRSILWSAKPDILMFMTDPRFYEWLWDMEHEIRAHVPMVYYHVWDNYPYPMFNKKFYDSNDVIASISKVTYDIVNNVSPEVQNHYIPHAVDYDIFKKWPEDDLVKFKQDHLEEKSMDRMIFFWNNRNARRKQSGTLIFWFNEFAKQVGPDNVCLLMHTDPKDPHGQDLEYIINELDIADGRIMLSKNKIPSDLLSGMYNIAACTINISDAEGFGLATLESLSCETPILVNMTGGLQEQVTDGEEWFGIGLEPASKAIIGSQQVPYIYEDRLNKEDFIDALHKIYNMSKEERSALGKKGREHVIKNYNFDDFRNRWTELMDNVHEKHGSWDERKNHKTWEMKEIA